MRGRTEGGGCRPPLPPLVSLSLLGAAHEAPRAKKKNPLFPSLHIFPFPSSRPLFSLLQSPHLHPPSYPVRPLTNVIGSC